MKKKMKISSISFRSFIANPAFELPLNHLDLFFTNFTKDKRFASRTNNEFMLLGTCFSMTFTEELGSHFVEYTL